MRRFEDALQRAVLDLLRVAAIPDLMWWHTPNGGIRSAPEAAIFKGLGVRAGIPDLLLCIPPDGRLAALELKGPRGRLSKAQIATIDGLQHAGALWGVATSIDDAFALLLSWGAIKRNRVKLQVVK